MATPADSLAALLLSLQASLTEPTQAAAALPDGGDLIFERTLSRPFGKQLDRESGRILALVGRVLLWTEAGQDGPKRRTLELDGELIKDGVYSDVVERVEGLLEDADVEIEKALGIERANSRAVGAKGEDFVAPSNRGGKKDRDDGKPPLAAHLLHDATLARPQLSFAPRSILPRPRLPENPEDEASFVPQVWTPILRTKVNAVDPTEGDSWRGKTEDVELQNQDSFELERTRTIHPYTPELAALTPPAEYFVEPPTPAAAVEKSFEVTPFTFINTVHGFEQLLAEIRAVGAAVGPDGRGKDLAIDLEHHDYRSWGGMTSLMQLSTREKDYVIDVLDPTIRDVAEGLNEFFTDPSWIKVFHGAQSDIVWLQRDLGLYIVGLFDTYHATKILDYSQHSLASLLAMYTEFAADKRYQLADWRIRPIPAEMLHYARSDTHFLLAIYDHLRVAIHAKALAPPPAPVEPLSPTDESAVIAQAVPHVQLSARQLLQEVFDRSRVTSSIVFELPHSSFVTGFGEGGWRSLLRRLRHDREYLAALAVPTLPIKTGWGPSELRLEMMRALHYWRERTARETDESPRWILSNLALGSLVEKAPFNNEVEMMACLSNVKGGASEIARARRGELLRVLEEGLARVTVGPRGGRGDAVEYVGAGIMVSVGVSAAEPKVVSAEGLWGAPVAGGLRAAISSVFGGAKASGATMSLVANISTLLGGGSSESTKQKALANAERMNKVRQVHDSLILGGGLANSIRSQAIPEPIFVEPLPVESVPAVVAPAPEAASMDHSYVPLSGRATKPDAATSSTQASSSKLVKKSDSDVLHLSEMPDKPKKRRRARVEVLEQAEETVEVEQTPEDPSPPKRQKVKKALKAPKVKQDVLEPHDYSSQRSILDAEPEGRKVFAGGKAQKKKDKATKMESFAVDTTDFRKTPRVNNAPKRGNVSMSFSK